MPDISQTEEDATRISDILEAAWRVIARAGSRKLRVQDVADEASVSKALVHYYFKTREELLARAYAYGDAKTRERSMAQMNSLDPGAVRISKLLLFYFTDEEMVRRDWIVWSELTSLAVFDDDLRPTMEDSFSKWIGWLELTIRQGIADGSIPKRIEPDETALRLTALIDGLGAAVARRLIDRKRAKEVLAKALKREFSAKISPEDEQFTAKADRINVANYLVALANLTMHAVESLETFASTAEERRAITRVADMLQRMTAGSRGGGKVSHGVSSVK